MTFTQLSNQETYLTIHEDGRIEVSENLQPSETAALVLECMRTKWMADAQSIKIRYQQDRIKQLEEALDTLTLVVGLTPVAGNKDALQEAVDLARAALRAKEAKL
jgi:hypothetical protein